MPSVASGRQRLNTTYMGRLSPRRDHSVRVDCSVDRMHTLPKVWGGGWGEREGSVNSIQFNSKKALLA
jgi:hypothetical protein